MKLHPLPTAKRDTNHVAVRDVAESGQRVGPALCNRYVQDPAVSNWPLTTQNGGSEMELNADFAKRVVVHSADLNWVSSPMPGVDRRMLDRIGGEVARATTIVRFAPESAFSAHTHGGGEEIIVLDGVFQDEHGDYPAGTYVRNPPTTQHTPGSKDGCVIFVKLWQFDSEDRHQMRVDMDAALVNGEALLFEDAKERVTFHKLLSGAELTRAVPDGAELLVLSGELTEGADVLKAGSWLRVPEGGSVNAVAGVHGARVWMKSGHLPYAQAPEL